MYVGSDINASNFKEIGSLFEKYQFESHIVSGDLNSKHAMWDNLCTASNGNGTKFANLFETLDYAVLNTGEHTRIAEVEGHTNSAIDLTVVSGTLFESNITWATYDDAMGSDHKPQVITNVNEEIVNNYEPPHRVIYKTDQADPTIFRSKFPGDNEQLKQLETDNVEDFDNLTKRIINHIITAANDGRSVAGRS